MTFSRPFAGLDLPYILETLPNSCSLLFISDCVQWHKAALVATSTARPNNQTLSCISIRHLWGFVTVSFSQLWRYSAVKNRLNRWRTCLSTGHRAPPVWSITICTSQIRDMSARPHPVSVVRPSAARITDFTDDIMHVLPFMRTNCMNLKIWGKPTQTRQLRLSQRDSGSWEGRG